MTNTVYRSCFTRAVKGILRWTTNPLNGSKQKNAPAASLALPAAATTWVVVSLSAGMLPLGALAGNGGIQAGGGLAAAEGIRLLPPLAVALGAFWRRDASFSLLGAGAAATKTGEGQGFQPLSRIDPSNMRPKPLHSTPSSVCWL